MGVDMAFLGERLKQKNRDGSYKREQGGAVETEKLLAQMEEFTIFYKSVQEAKCAGDFNALYKLCKEFLKKRPENVAANLHLIDFYVNKKEYENIGEIFDRLCYYHPQEKNTLLAQKEMIEKEIGVRF